MPDEGESVDTVLRALARAAPRPPPATLVPGTELGGRYTVVGMLGRGGMGAVYRARDAVLGKDVALKFVDDVAHVDRLRDEVALAHEVTHRNVCRTYDLEKLGDQWVVKMELIEGHTLAERITNGPALTIAAVIAIGRQIATGLAAAHDRGVVHRDLKPHNIMLEEGTGRAVLTDFGLARSDREAGAGGAGTAGYMAPEQIRGGTIDRRADIYALGCVLCAMLLGRVALPTPPAAPDPRGRADAPVWLVRAIERMIAADPARRPEQVSLAPPRSRRRLVIAGAAATAAVAITIAITTARPSRPPWRAVLRDVGREDEYTFAPVFSPDGTRLAYASNRSGPWRIYVETLADGRSAPIGPRSLSVVNPRWTRDGSAIAGVTYAQSTAPTWWYRFPLVDGADGELLADAPPRPCGAGSLVIRPAADAPGCFQLMLVDAAGSEREIARTLSAENFRGVACDAAGRGAVYAIANGPSSPAVWYVSLADGARRKLADRALWPTIHPDGRSVIATLARDGRDNLWELPVDGRAPVQLTFGPGPDHSPDVSPDGRQLVFVTGNDLFADTRIYRYAVPGGAARKLSGRSVSYARLMLAPDGTSLVAEARSGDRREIVIVATEGGDERVIATGLAPAFTPDGRDIVFAAAIAPSPIQIMPVAGGEPRTVATLSGNARRIEVDDHRVAHVWIDDRDHHEAWQVPLDTGAPSPEAPPPWLFVSPAPTGGWRVAFRDSGEVDAHVLAPTMALDDPGARVLPGIAIDGVSWVPDGTAITYIDDHTVHRLVVATGADEVVLELPQSDWNDAALSRDGTQLYVAMGAAHNKSFVITNYGDRPRP